MMKDKILPMKRSDQQRITADKKGNQRFPQIAFGNFSYPQTVTL